METGYTVASGGRGWNQGNRAGNLLMAVRGLMEASFVVCQLSGIYETEPVGIESEKNFLNMVAEIHIHSVSPSQMLPRLLRIEYQLGPRAKSQNRPPTVDLDILFF